MEAVLINHLTNTGLFNIDQSKKVMQIKVEDFTPSRIKPATQIFAGALEKKFGYSLEVL